jgi:very-short-patch-repair endonuclease
MSPPEVLLWSHLRSAKTGYKVRRQHPIGPYVVDFFVSSGGLVIEVDGSPHDFGNRPQRDEVRENYLRNRGYRVLRLLARDVLADPEAVLRQIAAQVATPSTVKLRLTVPLPVPGRILNDRLPARIAVGGDSGADAGEGAQ